MITSTDALPVAIWVYHPYSNSTQSYTKINIVVATRAQQLSDAKYYKVTPQYALLGNCGLKAGVCGIACEICPKMTNGTCPNGEAGCVARENKFCTIYNCAFTKGVSHCFECSEFPCENTKQGP